MRTTLDLNEKLIRELMDVTSAKAQTDAIHQADLDGHLIPSGNKQAVDRLDLPVEKAHFVVDSATSAQPRSPIPGLVLGLPPRRIA